jgi:membrane protein YdbS with pleckstrin-like domain
MLGNESKAGTGRRASWTNAGIVAVWASAVALGIGDVYVSHHWGRAGLYVLGAAVTLTITRSHRRHRTQVVDVVAVENYMLGREHRIAADQGGQVIDMRQRR